MKRLTCSDWIVLLLVVSLLVLLGALFIWYTEVTAYVQDTTEYPQLWMEYATCKRASFYTWDIPSYMVATSKIEVESPGYGGGSYIANFVACLDIKCWYDREFDSFLDGHEWTVRGKVTLYPYYGGNTYITGDFIRIDCRPKVFLPIIQR